MIDCPTLHMHVLSGKSWIYKLMNSPRVFATMYMQLHKLNKLMLNLSKKSKFDKA
jgi:hypothetical protein